MHPDMAEKIFRASRAPEVLPRITIEQQEGASTRCFNAQKAQGCAELSTGVATESAVAVSSKIWVQQDHWPSPTALDASTPPVDTHASLHVSFRQ